MGATLVVGNGRQTMLRSLFKLAVIGLICGALMLTTDYWTGGAIEDNRSRFQLALLTSMLTSEESLSAEVKAQIYRWQGQPLGDCGDLLFSKITESGYAGDIEFLVLRRATRTFTLRVTQHRETPGIGDFIDQQRDDWIKQFDRRVFSADQIVDNISGATITTNAVQQVMRRIALTMELYCDPR